MNYALFTLIFLYLSNWFQINTFLSLIIGPKIKSHSIDDHWIKKVVKKKTGLNLIDITIFEGQKPYGMMAGLPFWPKMILSEGLYKSFTKQELGWVILHEAAHCIYWHNIQAFIIELFFLSFGFYFINGNLFFTCALAVILSAICVQTIKWGIEYVADNYSINRVDDPNGVISAQAKFIKAYGKHGIFRLLYHWNIPSSLRIKMANQRLNKVQHPQKATPF